MACFSSARRSDSFCSIADQISRLRSVSRACGRMLVRQIVVPCDSVSAAFSRQIFTLPDSNLFPHPGPARDLRPHIVGEQRWQPSVIIAFDLGDDLERMGELGHREQPNSDLSNETSPLGLRIGSLPAVTPNPGPSTLRFALPPM